ncbi:unnamed protein product [Brassica napus]|uniref:(rape) hypothetical protein n=1 Tax=Brassica napus TaxID=3708 RepID=A0A816IQJ5_BRANA|nr:unnamed protein product [Brassica napus]
MSGFKNTLKESLIVSKHSYITAIVALVSTSKTRTKLSSEEDAAIIPEGCAATAATPKECPVLVRTRSSSSARRLVERSRPKQRRTVFRRRNPSRRPDGFFVCVLDRFQTCEFLQVKKTKAKAVILIYLLRLTPCRYLVERYNIASFLYRWKL